MFDFHIVVFFNDYYTLIVAFLTKQIQNRYRYRRLPDFLIKWVVQSVTLTNFKIFIAETSSCWDVVNKYVPSPNQLSKSLNEKFAPQPQPVEPQPVEPQPNVFIVFIS